MAKLRRFQYLDTAALNDYVSALEGGARESLQRKVARDHHGGGKISARVIEGDLGGSRSTEENLSFADTPQAQFQRLMELVEADPEGAGWVDIGNPDTDFLEIGYGALIDVECDLYVPDMVKALSASGGMLDALSAMEAFAPFIESANPDAFKGLPSKAEQDAMRGMIGALNADVVAVGDFDSSEWRVAGQLNKLYVAGEVEGPARLVGKVANKWQSGQWKPLLALPGSSLLPRSERRALERKKPEPDQEDQYLEGPALMLDILAIYR